MSFLHPTLALFNLSSGDIMIVMFLCLLMFGSKKLPELAKAFGQSMREFKKAANEVEDNFRTAVQEEDRKKATLPPPAANPTQSPPPGATPPEKL